MNVQPGNRFHIAESQNKSGWKRTLRSSNPAYDLTPPCKLDHGT